MFPSSTVENYLKAIFQAQMGLGRSELVPMGQLASALGVVPGTATTMVKTLAESGLVKYEPYAGVRLTAAGEKLAGMVLRRHRLIELFLVKVMGMSWTEVHDEAEHLEHAVSERLIERIDEMLGRPAVDPHGDPIPDQHGAIRRRQYDTLLTCPLHSRVTVSRVADQDAAFLKFVERHDLKPGSVVAVEERDEVADSVRLRGEGNREFTIGARAASKVLVEAIYVLLLSLLIPLSAFAQAPSTQPVPNGKNRPFEILDNSFIVEEAFNQEPGIFQNIFGYTRIARVWELAFTQEWPVVSQKHQLSYTFSGYSSAEVGNFGDVMINYRYQAAAGGPDRPAFSPRVSLIIPTDDAGYRSVGLQTNFPVSRQRGDFFLHWNAGLTWYPRAEGAIDRVSLESPHFSASVIYRMKPMLNLMLESVIDFEEFPAFDTGGTERETVVTFSPGARGGWNIGNHQLIVGAAIPIVVANSGSDTGLFLYLSYELPFKK